MKVLTPSTVFDLPAGAEASEPPERRGLSRDGGRLLVARPDGVSHHRFRNLPEVLMAGDLLVLNTSATLAAALDGTDAGGVAVPVHVSTELDDGSWVVELRLPGNTGPDLARRRAEWITLPGGSGCSCSSRIPMPPRRARGYGEPDRSRCRPWWPIWRCTASRSSTAICTVGFRWQITRRSMPANPVVPRCPAPVLRSPIACWSG